MQIDDGISVDDDGFVTHIRGEPLDEARIYRVASFKSLERETDGETIAGELKAHPERMPGEDDGVQCHALLVGHWARRLWERIYALADADGDGRLSAEEIDRMVQEAEDFADEDKKVREKIEARNGLENYVYSMKATLNDGEKGVADKIGDDDKEAIEKALEEANEWLDDNQEAEKEDFDEKLKEVQDACSPIISKVYRESGGAPGGGDFGGDDDLDGHDEL